MSSPEEHSQSIKTGSIYAVLAYLGWGFFPIYWKLLKHVPYLQILCHRVIWSFVFYSVVLVIKEKKFYVFKPIEWKLTRNLIIASILIMGNWLVYIYGVNSSQVIETSLGYFINPLVNILLGVLILKEKLSTYQKVATILAVIGVSIISFAQGHIPWIAVFLAVTFSIYGLVKKITPVNSLNSNQFESGMLLPLAFLYLVTQPWDWVTPDNKNISFILLLVSGIITGFPLLFFTMAAQKIPYYLMGFFQFLAPSIQFMSGVFIFHEPINSLQIKGFVFIWSAGLLLIVNAWWTNRRRLKFGHLKH